MSNQISKLKQIKKIMFFNPALAWLGSLILFIPMMVYLSIIENNPNDFIRSSNVKVVNLVCLTVLTTIICVLIGYFFYYLLKKIKSVVFGEDGDKIIFWTIVINAFNVLSVLTFFVTTICIWLAPINETLTASDFNWTRMNNYIICYIVLTIIILLGSISSCGWTNLRLSYFGYKHYEKHN